MFLRVKQEVRPSSLHFRGGKSCFTWQPNCLSQKGTHSRLACVSIAAACIGDSQEVTSIGRDSFYSPLSNYTASKEKTHWKWHRSSGLPRGPNPLYVWRNQVSLLTLFPGSSENLGKRRHKRNILPSESGKGTFSSFSRLLRITSSSTD